MENQVCEMSEQIMPLLEKLAVKFGTTADHLWNVLIAQAYVNATYNLFILAILFVILMVFLVLGKRWYKWMEKEASGEPAFVAYIPLIVMFVIFVGALIKLLLPIITAFYNPEYWALHEVLKYIGQ